MDIKIVTDSSSDILTFNGTPFSSVPLRIYTNEKEFTDDSSLDVDAMTSFLESYSGRSGSSCPNSEDWLRAFGDAERIICVTITKNLSGSYSSAQTAASEYTKSNPDAKVFVCDTLSVGPENALLIHKLSEWIRAGSDFDEIVERAREYMDKTQLIFALESLRNLANNGRANPIVAKLAGVLGIRVIGRASDEGTLEVTDKVRGEKKTLECIFDNMKARGYSGGRVRVHHNKNENGALSLREKILCEFPSSEVEIQKTNGLCSFYAERGGLLVGFECK